VASANASRGVWAATVIVGLVAIVALVSFVTGADSGSGDRSFSPYWESAGEDTVTELPGGGVRATRVEDGLEFSIEVTTTQFTLRQGISTTMTLTNVSDHTITWDGIYMGWDVPDSATGKGYQVGLGQGYGSGPPSLCLEAGETTSSTLWERTGVPTSITIVATYSGFGGPSGQAPPIHVSME